MLTCDSGGAQSKYLIMPKNSPIDAPGNWYELWSIVSDTLIGGLQHALNNRVAAVSALSQILAADPAEGRTLIRSLVDEVARLEGVVALLGQLRRSRTSRPEPVQLHELVEGLPALLAHNIHLREVRFASRFDSEVIPVLVERDQLTRILLTLLLSAGLAAERCGSRKVQIAIRGDDEVVELEVGAELPAAEAGSQKPVPLRLLHPGAAERAAAAMGGSLRVPQHEPEALPRYTLRLPTLLASRRGVMD